MFFFFVFLFIQLCCFGLDPNTLQQFIKKYDSSEEKKFGWSKVVYAIEKELDEIAFFYIKTGWLGDTNYKSRYPEWNSNKTPIHVRNILITCIRKNKLELLRYILKSKHANVDAFENWLVWAPIYWNNAKEVKEKRILNVAIEECENSLEIINILIENGANLNIQEHYQSHPQFNNPANGKDHVSYYRSPLLASIMTKKFDLTKYFVNNGAIFNGILPEVVKCGDLDLLEFFLLNGSSPHEGMETAIISNNKEAVILLLNFGVNPLSYIDLAVKKGNQEIIDILMALIFENEN